MVRTDRAAKNPVVEVLRKAGPLASNPLAEALVKGGAASSTVTARKMIERARTDGLVDSTYPVRFDKVFLYFLKAHRTGKYQRRLGELLPKKNSFDRVYKTLLSNQGWITWGQIAKASCCLPHDDKSNTGGRLTITQTIEQMVHLGLIEALAGLQGFYKIGEHFGSPGIKLASFRKKLALEQSMLSIFRDWLRNSFLLSWEKHSCRRDETSAKAFNQCYWDIHGPNYSGPFTTSNEVSTRVKKGVQSFVAADILGFRKFKLVDATSLVERVKSVTLRWRTIAVVPVVLAPEYSEDAWNYLRERGIVALTFKDVYGRNVEELLRIYNRLMSNIGDSESVDGLERSLELAKGSNLDEGLLGNLRGDLFELIVALTYKQQGYDTTLQKMVKKLDEDKELDVDVVAIRGEIDCKMVECKGRHKDYREEVALLKRHFENRCEAAQDPYGWDVTARYKNVEAVFITTGNLDAEAEDYAERTKTSYGIQCTVLKREAFLESLKELGQKRLLDLISTYY